MPNAKKDAGRDGANLADVHSCGISHSGVDCDDTNPGVLCGDAYAKKEELLQKYFRLKPALRETVLSQLLSHIDIKLLQETIVEIDKHM